MPEITSFTSFKIYVKNIRCQLKNVQDEIHNFKNMGWGAVYQEQKLFQTLPDGSPCPLTPTLSWGEGQTEAKMEPALVITHGDCRGQLYLPRDSRTGNRNRRQPAGVHLSFMQN